jgi:23S rRNA (adenine2503-C2)-methyltransferase
MKVLAKTGREDIATVYIAEFDNKKRVEFVESIQPPLPREKKWVLIISSLFGCCINCRFCDAGGNYEGKLSKTELLAQIDYMVRNRYPDRIIPVEKFKIQFARMGEPALNPNVLDVLSELPEIYDAPGLMPSISTVAPAGADKFFEELLEIKNKLYKDKFQMQFSIHTTDLEKRAWLIPVKKWSFKAISDYGNDFYRESEKKITLNFALADSMPVNPQELLKYFSPDKFLIKITPVNPTFKALSNELNSYKLLKNKDHELIQDLNKAGYDVILSIGELEENRIGSNCGQFLANYEQEKKNLKESYNYQLQEV